MTRKAIIILVLLVLGITAQKAIYPGREEDYREGSFKEKAKKTIKGIKETAEDAAQKVKDFGEHIVNTAEHGWEMIKEKAPKDGIPEMVSNAGWRLQRRKQRVQEYLQEKRVHSLLDDLDKQYVEHIPDSRSETKDMLSRAAKEIKVQANNAAEFIRGNTIGALGETTEKIGKGMENISEWLEEHTPTVVKKAKIQMQQHAKKVTSEAPNFMKQTSRAATDKLGEAAETVKAAGDKLKEKTFDAAGWIKDNTQETLEDSRKKFEKAAEYMKEHAAKPVLAFGEQLKEDASHAAEWIQEKSMESLDDAKEKLKHAADFIKRPAPKTSKKYDIYEYFTESFDDKHKKPATITEELEQAWEAAKKKVEKARKTVRDTIKKVAA